MKTLRVALTTAGALVALVGGAETATWGLGPLSTSPSVIPPQIVASEGAADDNAATHGAIEAATQSMDAAPSTQATPVVYTPPPAPPTNVDRDGPRDDNEPSAATASPQDSASATYPQRADQDASPSLSGLDASSTPRSKAISDSSESGDGPAEQIPD